MMLVVGLRSSSSGPLLPEMWSIVASKTLHALILTNIIHSVTVSLVILQDEI
jgi:hypothetical protein